MAIQDVTLAQVKDAVPAGTFKTLLELIPALPTGWTYADFCMAAIQGGLITQAIANAAITNTADRLNSYSVSAGTVVIDASTGKDNFNRTASVTLRKVSEVFDGTTLDVI